MLDNYSITMKHIDSLVKFVLKIIFPPQCLICGARVAAGVVAGRAWQIPRNKTFFCAECGARCPGMEEKICHRDVPYILRLAGPYDNPALKLLIHT